MGLFDSKEKKAAIAAAEDAVYQALSKVGILDDLVYSITNCDDEWVTKCMGYYDPRRRSISVDEDECQIKWAEGHYENGEFVSDIYKVVTYSYTSSGYEPLGDLNGVSKGRVLEIWATVLHDRLQAAMPDCKFEDASYRSFTYYVPALTWKKWM